MSEGINHDRRCFWGPPVITMAAMALASLAGHELVCFQRCSERDLRRGQTHGASNDARSGAPPIEGELPSLGSATAWLNSPPLTAGLRGKVVLIDFWTYSCINWLRSLPYVRAWAEKYKEQGLVVIGVHMSSPLNTTSITCAKPRRTCGSIIPSRSITAMRYGVRSRTNIGRLSMSSMRRGIFAITTSAKAHMPKSERIIQQLLAEAGLGGIGHELVAVEARGAEAAADWDSLQSPETYVGYERTAHFASPGGAVRDQRRVYAAPERLQRNHWAYG